MAYRPYWIVTLLASAALAGCATPVYEGRFAWSDGWRTGVVERIGLDELAQRRYEWQCGFSPPRQPVEVFAVVRWREVGRVRWRVAAYRESASIELNSAVYVNVRNCESFLHKRTNIQP